MLASLTNCCLCDFCGGQQSSVFLSGWPYHQTMWIRIILKLICVLSALAFFWNVSRCRRHLSRLRSRGNRETYDGGGRGSRGGDRQRDDRTPLRLELKTAQVGAPGLPKTATLGLGFSKRGRCNLARALQRGNTPCL